MTEKYRIHRTCRNCGNQQELFVTKREAAFDLVDYNQILGETCKSCGHEKFTANHYTPQLDIELFLEWGNDEALFLMEQDEELLLADERFLELILELLDNHVILEQKQHILMDALCIIVYNETKREDHKRNQALKQRVISELNRRKDKLKRAEKQIMDYIKEVVYPQLDIK